MTTWTPDIAQRRGPRYIAIAEAISDAVATGDLAPGTRMPTHRDLATRLGVTVGTVTRAYAEAIRRDLITGEVGRGTFVRTSPMNFTPLSTRQDDAQPDVFDFAVNLPAQGIAADRLRDTLPRMAAEVSPDALVGYPTDADLELARRSLAGFAESLGAPFAPDRLIVNNGAQNGMLAALLTLCRAGDTVLCDELTYPGMKNLARLLGVRLHGLAMDDHGMTVEALEHAILHHAPRAVYIVPNFQNPTGTVWPRDRREALARLATRHGIWIVEDDVFGFLAEDTERLAPLAALCPDRTIYLNSAAKCMGPGLRVGFMIGPAELLPALSAGIRLSTMTPAPLTLSVTVRWIEDGTARESCRWHRAEARVRRNLALKALDGYNVYGDAGSYHLWLALPEPWRSDEFTRAARHRGIIVSASDHFVLGRRAARRPPRPRRLEIPHPHRGRPHPPRRHAPRRPGDDLLQHFLKNLKNNEGRWAPPGPEGLSPSGPPIPGFSTQRDTPVAPHDGSIALRATKTSRRCGRAGSLRDLFLFFFPRFVYVEPIMPQRLAAFEILKSVLDQRQPLDEAFARHTAHLAPRDRAYARALTALALRRKPEIDAVIAACLARPLPPAARGARHVLAIGIAQALFMDTAPHAVAATAVELARKVGFARQSGLVNAVLRRVLRGPKGFDAARAQASLPEWLVAPWRTAYGAETTAGILTALLDEPPLDLTLKDPTTAAAWAERLGADRLATGTLRLRHAGAVEDLPGLAEGAWWVQDAAAALPAKLLGDVRGLRVADLCAAPGGKTLQLAAAGARVTAVDRSDARLRRLRENLARTGLTAEIAIADAATWTPPEPFDAVLLDAPCSATGTLRRHPDVAWTKSAADVDKLRATQQALLADVARLVKPDGRLVFCTCSLQPAEETASPASPPAGFAPEPIGADEIGGWEFAIRPDGALRTLPSHLAAEGGLDGFYAARFRRCR